MDYQKNNRYFVKSSAGFPVIILIIGAVILFTNTSAVIGILCMAVGVGTILYQRKNEVSDSDYDASVSSNLRNMKNRALQKLGLDEDEVRESDPISFDGYRYSGATKIKKGKDELWRTNKYESVILFFSQHEVHCYTYNYSTTEEKQTESTDVYFYRDIVSVSTTSESVKVLNTDIDYEAFKLTTAGGTSISVSLRDIDNAQSSINAMRNLLRAKKQA